MSEDDWIHLFEAHLTPLYRTVSRRVGGQRDLAEDVVQESWLRAVRTWQRDGVPDDPAAWLRTVAANLTRNHYRRPRPRTDAALAERAAPDEGTSADRERVDALHRGLARLRPDLAALLC